MRIRGLWLSPEGDGGQGTGGAAPPNDPPNDRAPVPYGRFQEVTQTAAAAKADAEAARAEAAAARAEAQAIKEQSAAWETERSTLTGEAANQKRLTMLARAGIVEDDHVDALASAYKAVPASERPKTEAEYWREILAGTRQAPRTLVGFLPAKPRAAADPPPPSSANPPPASSMTDDIVAQKRMAWERTGRRDNAEKKAYFEAVEQLRAARKA